MSNFPGSRTCDIIPPYLVGGLSDVVPPQTARRGGYSTPQTARRGGGSKAPSRRRKRVDTDSEVDSSEDEAAHVKKSKKKSRRESAREFSPVDRYTGTRPHPQADSQLLSLPAEIVDRILGDEVLNERDHLALSGSCTAIRLGYNDEVWKPFTVAHTPFSHNQFTYALLHNPCDSSKATKIKPEPVPPTPISRIWTNALIRAGDPSVKAGIDSDAPCYKTRHKRCNCLRFMGASHAKVISNVNLCKTTWGHIFHHYQSLSEQVDHTDFHSESKVNTKGERKNMYCLATVDAAILDEVGGIQEALRIRKKDSQGKRRGVPRNMDW